MAALNPLTRELVFKVVFYGPGLGGKTTTLQWIHANTKTEHRGKLVSLATPTDRTLYFDFLPLRVHRVRDMSVRLQLFTVPGQVYYTATRKLVLTGADGVVFVADSGPSQRAANADAWHELDANLRRLQLERVPVVVQYNKRDLPDRMELADAERFIDGSHPLLEACALKGEGVLPTFYALIERVWASLETGFRLRERFGIECAAFLEAVTAHVGGEGRDILRP